MNTTATQIDTSADSQPALLMAVTSEQVCDAIKAAGCAVTAIEQDGVLRLHSASHGVGFQVLWGNSAAPDAYVDFTLSCPLRVQGGALPEGVLGDWHRAKRFARVAQHGEFLVLEMDVVISGGVGPDYLTVALQLWTQMMGQFFLHLRNFQPAASDATADATADETADAPAQEEATAA
ncbi:YbjN domain-containing protein [Cupriavidus basilensis]|uniref:YbjN domain-containing protein n=1 Tax=Cupriavidus basilensis TaxID=68895 RepID=UPI0020A6B6BA|nr:YbjN domain-containing protein [Cupriavidus basilensis]MCP3019405.1 YbjN domain-containing protein [Cupriavidus basilensis]MDR3385239.1 YbjN domain-containing protein [Cupriavidus basilensis]